MREIANAREIPIVPIRARQDYGASLEEPNEPFIRGVINGPAETLKPIIYTHSSGSASLPKPIKYTHKRILGEVNNIRNTRTLTFGKLYSADVLSLLWSAIWERKCLYLYDDNQPRTQEALTEALRLAQPEALWTTPHELKLLAGRLDGLSALKHCRIVSSYGSRCSDELGDALVKQGVVISIAYGTYVLTIVEPQYQDNAHRWLGPKRLLSLPPHHSQTVIRSGHIFRPLRKLHHTSNGILWATITSNA